MNGGQRIGRGLTRLEERRGRRFCGTWDCMYGYWDPP